jgi:hypothetical protein
MPEKPLPPSDSDLSQHLSLIQSKIETIAEGAGVPPENRSSIEATLKALPLPARRHVRLFLQGVKAQTNDASVQNAADGFLSLAAELWGRSRSA